MLSGDGYEKVLRLVKCESLYSWKFPCLDCCACFGKGSAFIVILYCLNFGCSGNVDFKQVLTDCKLC
jgi:hypothetical protein